MSNTSMTNILHRGKDNWFTPDASGRLDTAPRAWGKYAIGMIALLIPFALLVHDGYWLNILTFTYLMAGLATAWNIIGGFGGQFSAGHAVFFGASAYLTARFYLLGISPWISLPLGGILAAVIAVPSSGRLSDFVDLFLPSQRWNSTRWRFHSPTILKRSPAAPREY